MPLRWMQFSLRSTPTRGTRTTGQPRSASSSCSILTKWGRLHRGSASKETGCRCHYAGRSPLEAPRPREDLSSAVRWQPRRRDGRIRSVVTRRLDHWDLRGAFGQLCERPNRDGNHLLGDPAYVSAGWTGLRNPLILHPTLELLHLVWRERHGFLPSTGSSRRCFPSSSHPSDAIPHRLRPVGRSPIKPALNKGAISNGIGTRGHWGGSLYRTAGQAPAPRTDRQEC